MKFDSLEYYRMHLLLNSELPHSAYTNSSHPAVGSDTDLLHIVVESAPGGRGLDAGRGAGPRYIQLLHSGGYESYGIDAMEENINLSENSTQK